MMVPMTQTGDLYSARDVLVGMEEHVAPHGTSRYGLVIGIETYRETRLNLRCARADAQAMYDLMIDPKVGFFPPENVSLLLDADATRDQIWRAGAVRRQAGRDDTVWIYYAGHGAREGDFHYWVTHDADVNDLYSTGLSSRELHHRLNDIRANRVITFLDCCHAAATTIQKNPTRDALPAAMAIEAFTGVGRVTFSSSDGAEKSVELSEQGHGAFTYFLTRGLRGEADTEGDGVVTADELWRYLDRQVSDASRRAGCPQTPRLHGELSHRLPLTINPSIADERQKMANAIESLLGLRDDRLRTEEAEFCNDLLRRPVRTPDEGQLFAAIREMTAGRLAVPWFRMMLRASRREPGRHSRCRSGSRRGCSSPGGVGHDRSTRLQDTASRSIGTAWQR